MEEQTINIILLSAGFSALFSFVFVILILGYMTWKGKKLAKKQEEEAKEALRNLFGGSGGILDTLMKQDEKEDEIEAEEADGTEKKLPNADKPFDEIKARQKANNIHKPNGS